MISQLYEQFSRNDSSMAPEKNFKLLKYDHVIYSTEARNLGDFSFVVAFAKHLNFAKSAFAYIFEKFKYFCETIYINEIS